MLVASSGSLNMPMGEACGVWGGVLRGGVVPCLKVLLVTL